MKKLKTILFSIALACSVQNSHAQGLICVTSGGTTTLYNSLDSAIVAAPSGAFIYLSGGSFLLNRNDTIKKPLHFVGAGYRPDSTLVTGKTFIFNGNGNTIYITDGADQSTFTGIDFTITSIWVINQTAFTNITFSRCIFNLTVNVGGEGMNMNAGVGNPANLFTFSECVFNSVADAVQGPSEPCTFDRCLFYYTPSNCKGSTYKHCSFVENFPNNDFQTGDFNAVFTNCAFKNCNLPTLGSSGSSFINCMTTDSVLPGGALNTNCLFRVSPALFYTNVVGTTFLFTNNYQLISGSPGHNYATDGTDVGIYGSAFPFKAGAVPYNPHFISGTLPPSTDGSGNLNITLTVGAQSR